MIYSPNLFAPVCWTLLYQSIGNLNVQLKNEAKCILTTKTLKNGWRSYLRNLKSLINTDKVLNNNEKILNNQDLAFLLKVSFRTLQRYRVSGQLHYFTIGKKTYYQANDIRAFVRERADSQTYKQFEKANQLENKPWKQNVAEKRSLCLGYSSMLPPQFSRNSYAFRLRSFR